MPPPASEVSVCVCVCVCVRAPVCVLMISYLFLPSALLSPAVRLLGRPVRLLAVPSGSSGVRLCVVSRKPLPQLCL